MVMAGQVWLPGLEFDRLVLDYEYSLKVSLKTQKTKHALRGPLDLGLHKQCVLCSFFAISVLLLFLFIYFSCA